MVVDMITKLIITSHQLPCNTSIKSPDRAMPYHSTQLILRMSLDG